MIERFLQFLIDNINLGTFFIAALTFGITFANFYRNRASIKVIQLDNSQSVLIKPDIIDSENPDVYWHHDYRLIVDLIVTNRSAKPISIVEFELNDQLKFNSYHRPGADYKVTTQPRNETIGGLTVSGTEKYIRYPIDDLWLQPVIDIPPHTSKRGFIFFHFSDEKAVTVGINKLNIISSRKTFTKDLIVFESQKSRLPLPSNIHSDRNSLNF